MINLDLPEHIEFKTYIKIELYFLWLSLPYLTLTFLIIGVLNFICGDHPVIFFICTSIAIYLMSFLELYDIHRTIAIQKYIKGYKPHEYDLSLYNLEKYDINNFFNLRGL
jgi:hypothetical protein